MKSACAAVRYENLNNALLAQNLDQTGTNFDALSEWIWQKKSNQHLTLQNFFMPLTNLPSRHYPRLLQANMSHMQQLFWSESHVWRNTQTIRSGPLMWVISSSKLIFLSGPEHQSSTCHCHAYFFPVRGFPFTSDSYKPKQQWTKKKSSD